jgi:PAP2 superfamily
MRHCRTENRRFVASDLPVGRLSQLACRHVTAVEPTAPTSAFPPAAVLPVSEATPRTVRTALPLRRLAWLGVVVAFVGSALTTGLPTDRVVLLGWVVAGLAVHAVVDGWRRLVRLLADWLPLVAVLVAYDATRGMADGFGIPVHVSDVAAVDRWLGAGVLPTVWLQAHVDSRAWEVLATLVYCSHFVVTPLVLAVLWARNRAQWARYVRMVLALSLAGLLTYVLFPAAPPWLAAKEGVVEPVARISNAGWEVLGLPRAGALLEQSQAQVNAVAAVPSLHTAFAVLTCLFLLPMARRTWQRTGLVLYAALMPVVLVWSGEHYVVDTLLGALYAAAVVLVLRRVPRPAPDPEPAPA